MLALLPFVCFLLFSPTFAWGTQGHKLTAAIADFYLTPSAKDAVHMWLNKLDLVNVSSDADSYLSEPGSAWSKDLHYCNLPNNATKWTMEDGCGEGRCAVSAVNNYTTLTAMGPRGPWTRYPPCPLAFLTHFYSDLHQPLHVAYASDRGGNSVNVSFLGLTTNLHSLWDSGWLRGLNQTWEELLPQFINEIEANPSWKAQWVGGLNPTIVAIESFDTVLHEVYDFLPNEQPPPGSNQFNLGLPYFKRNFPKIKTRIMQGGYRLASLLNRLF